MSNACIFSHNHFFLQCTAVQDLWNIAWISTSHKRNSLYMRMFATEFSNFIQYLSHINICDQICQNLLCLCKPPVATVAIILQPVECNVHRMQWVECLQNQKFCKCDQAGMWAQTTPYHSTGNISLLEQNICIL